MPLLERNAELYVSSKSENQTDTRKLSLLSGYTFNQDVRLVKGDRKGIAANHSRAYRHIFVNNVIRASARFSQYLTPFSSGDSAEKPFWIGLLGSENSISSFGNQFTISTTQSNLKTLQQGTIWVKYPQNTYKLTNTVIESANIDFGIDNFPTINWNITADDYSDIGNFTPTHVDASPNKCIIGKLTTVQLVINGNTYNLGIIEGTLNFSNSVRYTGRKRVGQVTKYLGHYTGLRSIEGEIRFFLHPSNANLVNYLLSQKENLEDSPASLNIKLGGNTSPNIEINLPKVILNMPETSYNQILSSTLYFTALESTLGAADELTVIYRT